MKRIHCTSFSPSFTRIYFHCAVFLTALTSLSSADDVIDFENDVVPILTKAGCNAGACHGAAIGRGGFKLSLYGGNPGSDYNAIVHEIQGRRINHSNPRASLLFLKPTEHVSHGGGTLFDEESTSAQLILKWINQGAKRTRTRSLISIEITPRQFYSEQPNSSHTVRVTAQYDDGTTRDVTKWTLLEPEDESAVEVVDNEFRLIPHRRGRHIVTARYLTLVKPIEFLIPLNSTTEPLNDPPVYNFIDSELNAKLRSLRITPSLQSADGEFIRRLSLDLTGRLPSVSRVRSFLESTKPDKRERIIESLLDSSEFNIFWAYNFSELLRIRPQKLGAEGANTYFEWLSSQIERGVNYKTLVTTMLLASGDAYEVGPANFYRTMPDARQQAEFASELLMGTRLRCANCHNHPLDHWTQDDYHGLAAIFAKLNITQSVRVNKTGTTIHPLTLEPAIPKLPGGGSIPLDSPDPRLEFTDWLTDEGNPYFAKALVNRLWKHMMGRGLVEPVDDFRETNPPTHPLLMDKLAREFVSSQYDIKHILKTIASSAGYQRSGKANQSNRYDTQFYSHNLRVPLHPSVHADAVTDVLGVPAQYGDLPLGTRAVELISPTVASRTLDVLGRCGREESCETEGNGASGLTQKLHYFNGEFLNGRISRNDGRLSDLVKANTAPIDIITEYYLAAYNRFPTINESSYWVGQLELQASADDRLDFLEDFIWGLLASKDFTTNH